MIDLVFWSFVVALFPIALTLASRFLAAVAGPLGPPDASPFILHGQAHHAPHCISEQISRMGGLGHGR